MSETRLETMDTIQAEKAKDITATGQPPLDDEGIALAEHKRSTFDLPINVKKADPLR